MRSSSYNNMSMLLKTLMPTESTAPNIDNILILVLEHQETMAEDLLPMAQAFPDLFAGGSAELAISVISLERNAMDRVHALTALNSVWDASIYENARSEAKHRAKISHSRQQQQQPLARNLLQASPLRNGHLRNHEMRMFPRTILLRTILSISNGLSPDP